MSPVPSAIFLVGARASGKSTVGRRLAHHLGWSFTDTDELLAQTAGMSVAEVVRAHGWTEFRARESATLRAACDQASLPGTVVATGGGMVLDEGNRRFMRQRGTVCYLHAPAALLAARLEADPAHSLRPPLTGLSPADEATEILRQREPLYREAAHHLLDAALPPDAVARSIMACIFPSGASPCP